MKDNHENINIQVVERNLDAVSLQMIFLQPTGAMVVGTAPEVQLLRGCDPTNSLLRISSGASQVESLWDSFLLKQKEINGNPKNYHDP